jgi:regulator of sigma E protease
MTHQLAFALPTFADIGKILVFIIMLSVLVVLHEYGHFIVARRNGVTVNDFALGMGPTLFKWTSPRSGTNYLINALPIGGYCAMKGEDGKTNEAEQQRQFRGAGVVHDSDNFQAKTPLQRLAIVVAGPIANFIIAIVLLVTSYAVFGVPQPSTVVGELQAKMPAITAGVRSGDRIVAVNGKPVQDGDALVAQIQGAVGEPLHLNVMRGDTPLAFTVIPVLGDNGTGHKVGVLGFRRVSLPHRVAFGDAVSRSFSDFGTVVTGTFSALGGLFTHPAATAAGFSGPVGLARASSQVQDAGWGAYFSFAALISISLGIFNLLPIPALDGGRGVFILVEMLRGKPVDPEKEALVHVGGFAILIALMLFVSWHDVSKLISGQGVF